MEDPISRRRVLGMATSLVSAIAAYFASVPFFKSFLPSARARALGEPVEIDLASIGPGQVKPFVYRGRTILVLRRTPEMLAALAETEEYVPESAAVEDPSYAANEGRSILPEFLVVEGVCTHFGCVPKLTGAEQGRVAVGNWWQGGFICPCHTSGYDYAGRVVRGPAPKNLPIPPHRYIATNRIIVGEAPDAT